MLNTKYRPQVFDDLVGQDSTKKILSATLKRGVISPCYLFSGTRGTGKTTTARLFAKGLLCSNPKNGLPCGECQDCRSVETGSNINLIEVDAASDNGVDFARSLKDLTQYSPMGAWRIIILDEAHSLTTQAQNSLLKTLESPTSKTVFMLCTTEPSKLLDTVLSRSIHFKLTPINAEEICDNLANIAESENIKIDNLAIETIARLSGGSMRDAQSLLGKLAPLDTISKSDIYAAEGYLSAKDVVPYVQALIKHSPEQILALFSKNSVDAWALLTSIQTFLKECLSYIYTKTTQENEATISWFCERVTPDQIIDILGELNIPKNTLNPSLSLEVLLLKLAGRL